MPFAQGGLLDALLKAVRERTQLAVQRNDFKLEQLQPHLFMNFRIVDEHGRQLGMGRDLAGLKAELGVQARSAFQALAALKRGRAGAVGAAAPRSAEAARRPAPQPSTRGRATLPRVPGAAAAVRGGPARATPPGPSANCPN